MQLHNIIIISFTIAILNGFAGEKKGPKVNKTSNSVTADKNSVEIYYLESSKKILQLPLSIDPDEPLFEYSGQGGTVWHGKTGIQIILIGIGSKYINSYLTMTGFFEAHNFTPGLPICFQLSRSNVGFNSIWEPNLGKYNFMRNKRIIFELGFNHESDHIVSVDSYENHFLIDELHSIDYINFSAFEYLKPAVTYSQELFDQKIHTSASFGLKRFFYVNTGSIRKMNNSFLCEMTIRFKVYRHFFVRGSGYYESISNDFVSREEGFRIPHNKENYRWKIGEFGFEVNNPEGADFVLFYKYENSNGRGADFLKKYEGSGFGIKFFI
jgi:hypothetical protein